MSTPAVGPDKAEVQRLVVYGYPLNRSRHFILRVKDPVKACEFLARLVQQDLITYASVDDNGLTKRGSCAMNIGFTYRGLERLGLPVPYLRVFQENANAFAEGARLRAARRLADTGPSAPEWWEECFKQDFAHVLLSMYADNEDDLNRLDSELPESGRAGLGDWGNSLEGCHLTADRTNRTVHFGFRDGIASPAIRGFHPERPSRKLHEPGEFLLGYENDDRFNPWLLVNPWLLPNPLLPPLAPVDPAFFRNGSFAAFRKIELDEGAFRAFVDKWSEKLEVTPEYVRAKLSGRWDDGSVVAPGQTAAAARQSGGITATDLDNFDFSDDPHGKGCPFGAHIRRMNPRNDQVVPFRKRPLIRRGMPYGPGYDVKPETPRGLLGVFFCANLEDQFEHLLSEWADSNPMGPDNRGNAKDPVIGHHENPGAVFDIPMPGETLCPLDGFTPFATTRGTLYAFFPGLTALGMIADIGKASS